MKNDDDELLSVPAAYVYAHRTYYANHDMQKII